MLLPESQERLQAAGNVKDDDTSGSSEMIDRPAPARHAYKCAVCEDDPLRVGLLGFVLGLLVAGACGLAAGGGASGDGAVPRPGGPAAAPIHIKLVIVAFMGSEARAWAEEGVAGHAVDEELPLPQGYAPVRLNRAAGVLLLTTGVGTAQSASTIAGFGMDPRFDLTQAYWIQTGIAGIDPAAGSVGSAVWANSIVDATLNHLIDPREMPAEWTFARFPLCEDNTRHRRRPQCALTCHRCVHLRLAQPVETSSVPIRWTLRSPRSLGKSIEWSTGWRKA